MNKQQLTAALDDALAKLADVTREVQGIKKLVGKLDDMPPLAIAAPIQQDKPVRLMPTREVLQAVGLSREWIWHLIKEGKFPASVSLTGANKKAWRSDSIQQWIDSRERS